MPFYSKRVLLGLLFAFFIVGCGDDPVGERPDNSSVLIVDQTGKSWDITHAVNNYGFVPNKFQFGIGPFAIKPIIDPPMLSRGDLGYPSVDSDEVILGLNFNNDARAYPISTMANREVVNTFVGGSYVAPVY